MRLYRASVASGLRTTGEPTGKLTL